jgi:hypothetical protein
MHPVRLQNLMHTLDVRTLNTESNSDDRGPVFPEWPASSECRRSQRTPSSAAGEKVLHAQDVFIKGRGALQIVHVHGDLAYLR